MNEFIRSRIASFKYAFQGWGYAMRTQRNVWIHSAIAIVVFFMGLWLQLPARDWAVIVLTAAMVFAAEFMNTAIEFNHESMLRTIEIYNEGLDGMLAAKFQAV